MDVMRVDPFELTAVDIASVGVENLHALSVGVGWPHRPDDWTFLTDFGRGFAALDEIGRVLGSAMWFPYSSAFATVGMVITSPRLQAQGAGGWLMKEVLAAAGDRAIGINATRASGRLYHALGFKTEGPVFQHQGEIRGQRLDPPTLPPRSVLRRALLDDLPALVALDAAAFGVPREALLRRLAAVSQGQVLVKDGRVQAFALRRAFGRGFVIGPIVASCDADAIAVTHSHLARRCDSFLRIDTRQATGDFPAFLTRCGLLPYDTVETMALRRPWLRPDRSAASPTTYGLASQGLG